MDLGYKYRIYPTLDQQKTLAGIFGTTRFVYNWGLAERTRRYKAGEKFGFVASSREFTKLRNNPDFSWLKTTQSATQRIALQNLERAYLGFFKKNSQHPKFKKKTGTQSATYRAKDYSFKVSPELFSVSGIGELDIRMSRPLPSKPTQVTISKTPTGKYYASFLVKVPVKKPTKRTRSVGVDLGVKTFAVLSNGEKLERPADTLTARLKLNQRRLAKKQKGSNRRNAQRVKVAKLYEKIAHKREDYRHKVARSLVRRFDRIYIEDLNVKGMTKNHSLARVVSDASFGAFRRVLEYKAKLYGKQVIPVGRFFPSSKLCSACGLKNEALTLADRAWTCSCGVTHDRDVNAAKNILAAGLAVSARGVSNVNV